MNNMIKTILIIIINKFINQKFFYSNEIIISKILGAYNKLWESRVILLFSSITYTSYQNDYFTFCINK